MAWRKISLKYFRNLEFSIFLNFKKACMAEDDIKESVANGRIDCNGASCALKCDNYFHRLDYLKIMK